MKADAAHESGHGRSISASSSAAGQILQLAKCNHAEIFGNTLGPPGQQTKRVRSLTRYNKPLVKLEKCMAGNSAGAHGVAVSIFNMINLVKLFLTYFNVWRNATPSCGLSTSGIRGITLPAPGADKHRLVLADTEPRGFRVNFSSRLRTS